MFPRYFFTLCALVLFAAVVNISATEEPKIQHESLNSELENKLDGALDDAIQERNIIDEIIKILEEAFTWAAKNCLKEAAKKCKKYWYNPKKLLNCAKDYFKENEGDCAIPEY